MSETTAANIDANHQETEYLILTKQDNGYWRERGRVPSRSATAAIRTALENLLPEQEAETVVAVPARSWKPVTAQVEVKRTLTFKDA